jgi:YegS/Rv2252/BmrU family lipid kinase
METHTPAAAPAAQLRQNAPARRPVLVLANRYAGALSRLRQEKSFAEYARAAGLEPEVVYTRSGAHLRRILRQQVVGRRDLVAVAGGDGTIHQAVQELAGTGVALGILPQGTANNFATALRLPMDLPSAFRVIAEGEERAVDLGEAAGEYFTEGAGVGIFADTLKLAACHRRTKNVLRTVWVLLRLMLLNRHYRLTLAVDGVPYAEEAFSVTVANSFAVGLNIPIAPQARLTDAQLDVVVIGALERKEYWPYYRAIRSQTHVDLPKVHTMRGQEIVISARRRATVHVDDRPRGYTPVTIRVVPGALKVMVDRL